MRYRAWAIRLLILPLLVLPSGRVWAAPPADQQIQLIYAPWTKFCLKGEDSNAKTVCFTGKDGRIETGQPVVAAVVIEPEGEAKKILRVTLPLGMLMVHGTRIIVDNNTPLQAPFATCFQNGCMSDYDLTPDLIKSMKKGQNLVVQAINSNNQPVTLPLPLSDFAKAFDGPPTDPKVFEANQKRLQEEIERKAAAKNGSTVQASNAAPVNSQPVAEAQNGSSVPYLRAPTGRRVALIVGNSAYKYMPVLPNPKNDAVDVESALKKLGFETVVATDVDRNGMNAAVDRFSRMVQNANVAMVYYSGHGMQFNGKNYLLPTDADLQSAADVNRYRLMPVDELVDVLAGANGLQLIVLDACRNNPVERDFKNKVASAAGLTRDASLVRGFTRMDARSGLIITYATAPNEVAADGDGRNSPFTRAFLNDILTPNLDVRQVLFKVQSDVYKSSGSKQLPEISSLYVGPDVVPKAPQ